jgi:hypothetical protein
MLIADIFFEGDATVLDTDVLSGLHRWFTAYVKTFYTDDKEIHDKVKMKEEHTFFVAEYCRDIAASLGLGSRDRNLAEAVGLCHDVGRFKQVTIYRTFRDRDSVDHGPLGVEELEKAGIAAHLSETEWATLAFAVRWHNAIALPPADERTTLFAQIVRDADKLDIYRVVPPPPPGPGCLPVMESGLIEGKMLSYNDIKSRDDHKLVMLSWLYDIHFPWTLRAIVARGYIERIVAALPPSPALPAIRTALGKYLAARLPD